MPEYLTPGVYIEEIERGPRPIEGVPTSTAAFLGETERGSITPNLVTSYKEYERQFGRVYAAEKFMPFAVNGFFENGGKNLYVCRVVSKNAISAELAFGNTFSIRAAGAGNWGNRVYARIDPSTTKDKDGNPVGFRIRLAYFQEGAPTYDPFDDLTTLPRPFPTEDFDDLVTDESLPDYYGKRLQLIDMSKPDKNQGPESSALGILIRKGAASPAPTPGKGFLKGGSDDAPPIDADYDGNPDGKRSDPQGLLALELDPYRDVALVYAPAASDNVVKSIIGHCERMRFRFAAIDTPRGLRNIGDVNPRFKLKVDSSYGAFYYPWIQVSDPTTGAQKLVPPGGHALGVYARTDTERGVFKAPANETMQGVIDLEYDITDNDQATLNPRGANAIRSFPSRGIRIWGARTLTSNGLWKYVSVRRLFIFLERSIYEGTQWVVFEPNDPRLWARVVDTIRIFLRGQWRLGALFGRTEDQAFFVTCDETTMTKDDVLNGRLICEIGIAPVRPAEFVVFRIFQNTAEAQR
jgi:phage tail sheath protein FI